MKGDTTEKKARRTQTGIAGEGLARAIREYGRGHKLELNAASEEVLERLAATFNDIGLLPLEGDYDVLVARGLRAIADEFRQANLRPEVIDAMRELLAEIREAGV